MSIIARLDATLARIAKSNSVRGREVRRIYLNTADLAELWRADRRSRLELTYLGHEIRQVRNSISHSRIYNRCGQSFALCEKSRLDLRN